MRFFSSAFDLFFQKSCLVCDSFSTQKVCHRCLIQDATIVSLSSELYPQTLARIKDLNNIFSIYKYETNARDYCLAMKNRPSQILITLMARKVAAKIAELYKKCEWDYLVPLPSSRQGMRLRGYNHMLLFCKILCETLDSGRLRYIDILKAAVSRAPQSSLSRSLRTRALYKRFKINNKYFDTLRDKRILLVDDILTTGSTLAAAAFTLSKVHVKSIDTFSVCFTQHEFVRHF